MPPPPMTWQDDDLLTVNQVAKHFQFSVRRFRELLKEGKMPEPIEVGNAKRWLWRDVREWIACAKVQQKSKVRNTAKQSETRRSKADLPNADSQEQNNR